MDKTKVAKGKLNVINSFSTAVAQMLKDTAKDGMPDGADTLLPASIYVLLQLKRD